MDDKKITITQTFAAPIATIWEAWTKERELKAWMSPEEWTTPEVRIDLQVGGEIHIVMAGNPIKQVGSSATVSFNGIYQTVEKPTKLVFTWNWQGQQKETLVTILFKLISPMQTEITLIHEGFTDDQSLEQDTYAWKSTLKHLQSFLEKKNN